MAAVLAVVARAVAIGVYPVLTLALASAAVLAVVAHAVAVSVYPVLALALAESTVLVVVARTVAVSVHPVLAHALALAAAGPSAMVAAGRQSGGPQTDYHLSLIHI